MIGSLRRKVFWSILLSAAGVLLAILLAINVLKLVQTASKAESILDSAMFLLSPERTPEGEPERGPADKRGGGRDRSELLRSVSADELGALALDENGREYLRVGCADRADGTPPHRAALEGRRGQDRPWLHALPPSCAVHREGLLGTSGGDRSVDARRAAGGADT